MTWASWNWPDELAGGTWLLIAAVFSVTLIIAQYLGIHGYAARSAKLLLAAAVMIFSSALAVIKQQKKAARAASPMTGVAAALR